MSTKKGQFTQERVEYNVKSLKIFKISLTFCFDKLSNLSKSVYIGENSQIPTVSNKKNYQKKRPIWLQIKVRVPT
jgi:hypothetical protein